MEPAATARWRGRVRGVACDCACRRLRAWRSPLSRVQAEKEAAKAKRDAEKAARDEKARWPKKPKSSYLYYCEETREALKKEHPEMAVTDLAKLQGAAWKELDEETKQKYMDLASGDVLRYKSEMEAGGYFERERELKKIEEEKKKAERAASGEPAAKKQKTPTSKKKKKGEVDWYIPDGYAQAAEPPSEAELTFGNEAGDALVGKHIMFNWEGVGWCEGIVDERNKDEECKIDGEEDRVNFWVHYAIDDNTSKHNLEMQFYGGGPEADYDSWVLLDKLPEGEGAKEDSEEVPMAEEAMDDEPAKPDDE